MTKQEKIKQEYIELFDQSKSYAENSERYYIIEPYIDSSGWFSGDLRGVPDFLLDKSGHEIRPKTLHGIEDNNDWFRIVDNVLPEKNLKVFWLNLDNKNTTQACMTDYSFNISNYSHWKNLPTLPLY